MQRDQLLTQLQQLNGGNPIDFALSDYPLAEMPSDFDSWYAETEANSPELQYFSGLKAAADCNVTLSRRQRLPKWSVGYMGEFVPGQTFQGVTAGLTLPLWENRGRVKHAQTEALAASLQFDDMKLTLRSRCKILYNKVLTLQESIEKYEECFSTNNNSDLLYKSYISGQITLLNYLLETDYYLSSHAKHLQLRRNLELTLSELNMWKL